MLGDTVLFKTQQGVKEIESRSRGLSQKLRMVLIMIDGQATVEELKERVSVRSNFEQFVLLEESLELLMSQGYISDGSFDSTLTSFDTQWDDQHISQIKRQLVLLVKEMLGNDGAKVVSKLEAAPNNREDLVGVVRDCKKLVRLFIDEEKAEALATRCTEILDSKI